MIRRAAPITLLCVTLGCAEGDVYVSPPTDAADVSETDPDVATVDDLLDDLPTTPEASPPDADDAATVDAAADVMDASVAPDAGPLADGMPTDAVMFFTGIACPRGWTAYAAGNGRVALPAAAPSLVGVTRGVPLADGEDRAHTHTLSGSFTTEGVSYVGIVGGGNGGLTGAGAVDFMATTAPAAAGIPYVQLLVCRKTDTARVGAALPRGMLVNFASERCPSGFSRPDAPQGHLPVGLPMGGLQGARFGASPPASPEERPHQHDVMPSLVTTPHGIALASGCCGSGYAREGTYRATVRTSATESAMPSIQLLMCQKD